MSPRASINIGLPHGKINSSSSGTSLLFIRLNFRLRTTLHFSYETRAMRENKWRINNEDTMVLIFLNRKRNPKKFIWCSTDVNDNNVILLHKVGSGTFQPRKFSPLAKATEVIEKSVPCLTSASITASNIQDAATTYAIKLIYQPTIYSGRATNDPDN